MVRRYAHLAAEHLAVYVSNTESYGTNTAQQPNNRISAAQLDCNVCKCSEAKEICGGQGRNRTTDTRIFSPDSKIR
jgi:hypothetical protein